MHILYLFGMGQLSLLGNLGIKLFRELKLVIINNRGLPKGSLKMGINVLKSGDLFSKRVNLLLDGFVLLQVSVDLVPIIEDLDFKAVQFCLNCLLVGIQTDFPSG